MSDLLTGAVDINRAIYNFFGGGDQAKWNTVAAQINAGKDASSVGSAATGGVFATTVVPVLTGKVTGDSFDRFQILAGGKMLGGLGNVAPAVEFKPSADGTGWEFNKSFLHLRADTSITNAPELHFHSLNGWGADKRVWGMGIDIVGRPPYTATTDFVIFKFTPSGVIDSLYGLNRGANAMPTWGFGNASATDTHLVTMIPDSGEAAMGGLLLWMPTGQTGKAFTIRDGGGTDRITFDSTGTLKGWHALTDATLCIEAPATKSGVLSFRDNAGANYFGFTYNGGPIQFKSITGGTVVWEAAYNLFTVNQAMTIADNVSVGGAGKLISFFGGTKRGKPAAPVTLADVIAVLGSSTGLGLTA